MRDILWLLVLSGVPATIGLGQTAPRRRTVPSIQWVRIEGGQFLMGNNGGKPDEQPAHVVTIRTFLISKAPVTVEQYAECVRMGKCRLAGTVEDCNNGKRGMERHPVDCVTWDKATQFARFVGARLPTEAEWEFAARSRGKAIKYPWGNQEPDCNLAVMRSGGRRGCGTESTWPVCSLPAGNTEQGLCDMAGNVLQWVQDEYHPTYEGAPRDGAAWQDLGSLYRVNRGGGFRDRAGGLRTTNRHYNPSNMQYNDLGIRLVRDVHD